MFQAATTHSAPVATNGRALSTNDPVKSGAYGGDGGDAVDDYNTLGPSSLGVSSIQVWSGNAIDRLVITYKDGHEVTHGDNSGGIASETFNVGSSYITKVSIRSGNVVDQLQFELADGRKSAVYGGNGGDAHSCQAPEGTAIVSFFGGAGNYDQLGAIRFRRAATLVRSPENGLQTSTRTVMQPLSKCSAPRRLPRTRGTSLGPIASRTR